MNPKFNIGAVVWCAGTRSKRKNEPCPDCLGTKQWYTKLPSSVEMFIPCPTCSGDGVLGYTHVADVFQRTIGSVRMDTAARDGEVFSYMCEETGIGTGTIYYEPRLFATEAEAQTSAEQRATEANARAAQLVRRRKNNHPGILVGYLRRRRTETQKQIDNLTRHIDSLTTKK